MPGVYLMPNGQVASVDLGDGRRSLVSRAKFEECCCPPQCQWLSVFEWSCQDEEWIRVSDSWVDKVEPPDTVIEQGDCVRFVYGLFANCDIDEDERPEVPPDFEGDPPEEPVLCCAPKTCPCSPWPPSEWPCNGLLQQYVLESFSADTFTYAMDDTSCSDPLSHRQTRTVSPITLTAHSSIQCRWSGGGDAEQRFYDFEESEWGSWQPISVSVFIGLSAGVWFVFVSGFGPEKRTGQTPVGSYGRRTPCGGTPPGRIVERAVIS
jgi:hypothetical protein